MTTRKQAVAELARLHGTYCPLVDKLVAAARAANTPAPMVGLARTSTVGLPTATADRVILDEQRQAKRIVELAEIAWGPAAMADLRILHPTPEDLRDIAPILKLCLDNPLHAALIGCHVRGQRLGRYLRESPPEPVHDMMRKIAARYAERIDQYPGKPADLKWELAKEFKCLIGTVRDAITRNTTVV